MRGRPRSIPTSSPRTASSVRTTPQGEQVDNGDYAVVDAGTLSFASHAAEFGYDGDILVNYTVSGDTAEFEVQVPSECDDACLLAHAWALSAFFGPEPWTRTD